MSKTKQRHGNKARKINNQSATGLKNMGGQSGKSRYTGAARFIEVAPPGIQFRGFLNVDHITSITFAAKMESVKVFDEEGVEEIPRLDNKGDLVVDSEGIVIMDEAPHRMENRTVGHTVAIGIGGQTSEFTFSQLHVGVMYYNDVLDSISAIGIPCNCKPKIRIPPPPPVVKKIVDTDGEAIEAEDVAAELGIEAGEEGEDLEDPVLVDELDDLPGEVDLEDETPTEH